MRKRRLGVLVLLALLLFAGFCQVLVRRSFSITPFFCTAEVHTLPPLADLNSSVYGLEVPANSLAVGDNFTIELHIRNATASNLPFGLTAIEAHFSFANILGYCVPTGFTDFLGKPGGFLNSPLVSAIDPGFYDLNGTKIDGPSLDRAVDYEVAEASFGESWNGIDGVIANLTFQIIKQPSENESSVNLPFNFDYCEAETAYLPMPWLSNDTQPLQLFPDTIGGNLVFDSSFQPTENYSLNVQLNPAGSGTVNVAVGGIVQTQPYIFAAGTNMQVAANPEAGYVFSNWTLDNVFAGSESPYSLAMNENHSLVANFASAIEPVNALPLSFSAEPIMLPPLISMSASSYDLQIPSTEVAVGSQFVVELHLRNATSGNVPSGVGSLELHFYFGDILNFVKPIRFSNFLGASEGVLNPAVQLNVFPEYHNSQGNDSFSPYNDAVSYDVAASSTGNGWNSADGLIANLTFEIVRQPQVSQGEDKTSFSMGFRMCHLNDSDGHPLDFEGFNATITLDSVSHNVTITNFTLSQTIVGSGYPISINFTLSNFGSVTEQDFSVIVYANTSVLDCQTFTLASGNFRYVTFERNTTGFAKGLYILNATIEGTSDEVSATNTNQNEGTITVTIPGDIDGNGKVSLNDLVRLANAFQTHIGTSAWNPNADIDCNGIIDSRETAIVASHFGQCTS